MILVSTFYICDCIMHLKHKCPFGEVPSTLEWVYCKQQHWNIILASRNTCFRILSYIMCALGRESLEFDVQFCHQQPYKYFSACWSHFFLWIRELQNLVSEWTPQNRPHESGLPDMLKHQLFLKDKSNYKQKKIIMLVRNLDCTHI